MRFQLGWLRAYVDLPEEATAVAERLTSIGFTVDGLEGDGDGCVLEVDVPGNRCDAMCHVGLARELAAAFERELRVPVARPVEDAEEIASVTSVTVLAPDLCPRYVARVIRGVTMQPSPGWLADRLSACGIRPINVVVDVTNFVMLELGQPLHAFDLALLSGRRIVVRRAVEGETLITLDGQVRTMGAEALLIADAARGVAVAGVMGGADTEIRQSTSDVLLESAWFDPASVRRTSRRLGLRGEASQRFERGVDRDVTAVAADRAAMLLSELAGATVLAGRIDVQEPAPGAREVTLRLERLRCLTGADVPLGFVEERMGRLGFERVASVGFERQPGDSASLTLRVPRRRHDVEREEDPIEDVLRHWGFDRVTPTLPAFAAGAAPRKPWERALASLRRALVAAGYHQAINFSFGSRADMATWGDLVHPGSQGRLLELQNPIKDFLSVMRTSLLPGLLQAVSSSLRRGETDVKLFEDGCTFFARGGDGASAATPADERRGMALVATGRDGSPHFAHRPPPVDFLTVKGALLDALATMVGKDAAASLTVVALEASFAAPGSSGEVRWKGRRVGWLARVHPRGLAALEIAQPLYAAEVDLESMLSAEERRPAFGALSRFPKAVRDVSVLVDRNRCYGDIIAAAETLVRDREVDAGTAGGSGVMESIELVDRYLGPGVPEGQVSLTLSVVYRLPDRTLSQEEVDAEHTRLVRLLESRFGATLRA